MNKGFTLVELLLVMAVMAVVSVVTFTNYKAFREDQDLKKGMGQIQTVLRNAQTNASTRTRCHNFPSKNWSVKFSKVLAIYQLDSICRFETETDPSPAIAGCVFYDPTDTVTCTISTLNLDSHIVIEKLYTPVMTPACEADLSNHSIEAVFFSLTGKPTFDKLITPEPDPPPDCFNSGVRLTLDILNTKPNPDTSASLVIDTGGTIFEK